MTTETLTFEFQNDTQRDSVVDILAEYFAYPAKVNMDVEQTVTDPETGEESTVTVTEQQDNPMPKVEHVRNGIAKWLGGVVKEILTEKARAQAKTQIEQQVNAISWR